ncbi:hypothetical protein Slin15195_G119220 [Septoria linicola]|uniref:Uncharacterized protein n=1 Tax=Septoria linicola TaxID=215465 RepID=A0A9Q9B710_9PEZI|nr:hypothetical protein Slin14017_G096210 [Septoria linicola]USW58603.1 hypothetical protein Slin15195_G119220 [Septoria linicola]
MYMPIGEHDPQRHRPELGGVLLTDDMIAAGRQAQAEAKQAEQIQLAELEASARDMAAADTCDITTEQPSSRIVPGRAKESRTAVFTCAGRLPIVLNPSLAHDGRLSPRTGAKQKQQKILLKPVTIRWGPDRQGRLLSYPVVDPVAKDGFQQLIRDCVPATFGRDG